jgi:hypothetical protein
MAKKALAYSMRAEMKATPALLDLRWEIVRWWLKLFTALCPSVNHWESISRIYFEVTNTFEQAGEFANLESTKNEGQLSLALEYL